MKLKIPYLRIFKCKEYRDLTSYEVLKGNELHFIEVGKNIFRKKYIGTVKDTYISSGRLISKPSKKMIVICQQQLTKE